MVKYGHELGGVGLSKTGKSEVLSNKNKIGTPRWTATCIFCGQLYEREGFLITLPATHLHCLSMGWFWFNCICCDEQQTRGTRQWSHSRFKQAFHSLPMFFVCWISVCTQHVKSCAAIFRLTIDDWREDSHSLKVWVADSLVQNEASNTVDRGLRVTTKAGKNSCVLWPLVIQPNSHPLPDTINGGSHKWPNTICFHMAQYLLQHPWCCCRITPLEYCDTFRRRRNNLYLYGKQENLEQRSSVGALCVPLAL